MVEKIPVTMVPYTSGVVKNIDKTLFVSTDVTDGRKLEFNSELNQICLQPNAFSPNHEYSCDGTIYFFEHVVANQSFNVTTDYGSKYNAYFCFMFHIFLENPAMNPTICASWG